MHQSVDGNIQEVPDLKVYGAQRFHIVLPESARVHHPHLGRGKGWKCGMGKGKWGRGMGRPEVESCAVQIFKHPPSLSLHPAPC